MAGCWPSLLTVMVACSGIVFSDWALAESIVAVAMKKTIQATITRIGQQRGLAFVVNTDGGNMPYLSTIMGEDITEEVIKASR
jgi:Skp family chaperone for outer membrane proteins